MSTAEEQKLEIRITRVEDTLGRMEREMINLQEIHSDISSLALSVNSLCGEVKHMREELCKTTQRVDRIELKPSQKWDKLMDVVMGALAGGLIGYMLAMILK